MSSESPWVPLITAPSYTPGLSYWVLWRAAASQLLVSRRHGGRVEVSKASLLEFVRERGQKDAVR